MSTAEQSANPVFLVQPAGPERNRRLAYLMLKEGKAFQPAALEAGFPPSIAKQGLQFARKCCTGIDEAFAAESKLHLLPDEIKGLALHRLIQTVIDRRSDDGIKAIEVLGKFKELDWFVRQSDVQLGVFLGITEEKPSLTVSEINDAKE